MHCAQAFTEHCWSLGLGCLPILSAAKKQINKRRWKYKFLLQISTDLINNVLGDYQKLQQGR